MTSLSLSTRSAPLLSSSWTLVESSSAALMEEECSDVEARLRARSFRINE